MKSQSLMQSPFCRVKLTRPGRRERGATLLEVTSYLAVAAVVIFGAAAMFGKAFSAANANQLNEQVTQIRTNIRAISYANPSLTLTNAVAKTAKINPATMVFNSDAVPVLTGNGGTKWTIAGTPGNPVITIDAVDPNACLAFLTGLANGGAYDSVKMGPSTDTDATVDGSTALSFPMDPATISTKCASSARKFRIVG